LDIVSTVVVIVMAAFIWALVWLSRNHITEKEETPGSLEVRPEHVATTGVVTNDPTLATVAYAVDPPPLEEGLSIEDALAIGAIADTLVDPPVEIQKINMIQNLVPEESDDSRHVTNWL
jgi:hypothetical protein